MRSAFEGHIFEYVTLMGAWSRRQAARPFFWGGPSGHGICGVESRGGGSVGGGSVGGGSVGGVYAAGRADARPSRRSASP